VKLALVALPILVGVALTACGGNGGSSGPSLVGSWNWEGSNYSNDTEATPDDPSKYTLELTDDGSVSVVADCNRSSGTWESDAGDSDTSGSLAIKLGPTTLAECGPGSLYRQFLRDLSGAAAFELSGEKLRIDIRADVGSMTFGSPS
jgi:heat shock protein HslJ